MNHEYEHALAKVLDAAEAGDEGPGPLSTGEALMAALALNRPDWLARMGYTMVEALERIGAEWLAFLPRVAREVADRQAKGEQAKRLAGQALAIAQVATVGSDDEPIRCQGRYLTHGHAPGYRDVGLHFELRPDGSQRPLNVEVRLGPEEGERLVRDVTDVHAFAWSREAKPPLDIRPGEKRPAWLPPENERDAVPR